MALRVHKSDSKELAELHYRLSLQYKSFTSFRRYLVQQRKQSEGTELAKQFHTRTRLQQCWTRWLQRCEHNEEIALGTLTRKARCHVASKLTRKVLEAWVKYVLQRRHKNRLKQVADQHFRESALPKYVELIEQRLGGTFCVCV